MTDHITTIGTGQHLDGHRAVCLCDWEGPIRDTESEAAKDLQQHHSEQTEGRKINWVRPYGWTR